MGRPIARLSHLLTCPTYRTPPRSLLLWLDMGNILSLSLRTHSVNDSGPDHREANLPVGCFDRPMLTELPPLVEVRSSEAGGTKNIYSPCRRSERRRVLRLRSWSPKSPCFFTWRVRGEKRAHSEVNGTWFEVVFVWLVIRDRLPTHSIQSPDTKWFVVC